MKFYVRQLEMSWSSINKFIFVSPHYDDIVLSCAATVIELIERNFKCEITTICGGIPEEGYVPSQIACEYIAEDLGLGEDQIKREHCLQLLSLRKIEDLQAMKKLGVSSFQILQIPDAIYRSDGGKCFYEMENDLFGEPQAEDESRVAEQILKYIYNVDSIKSNIWIFPAISNHVDHQILTNVGKQIDEEGYKVIFYAEVPYWNGYQQFSDQDWTQISINVKNNVPQKLLAIKEYRSQLKGLFGGEDEILIQQGIFNSNVEVFWIRKTSVDLIHFFHSIGRGLEQI